MKYSDIGIMIEWELLVFMKLEENRSYVKIKCGEHGDAYLEPEIKIKYHEAGEIKLWREKMVEQTKEYKCNIALGENNCQLQAPR